MAVMNGSAAGAAESLLAGSEKAMPDGRQGRQTAGVGLNYNSSG